MNPIPDTAVWAVVAILALLTAGALLAGSRSRRTTREHAERIDALGAELARRETALMNREADTRRLEEESAHLVERLRAVAETPRADRANADPGPLHPDQRPAVAAAHDAALAVLDEARREADRAAFGLLGSVARKFMAQANGQQRKLTEMTRRHDDAEFLHDLMAIDHDSAQILRRAVAMGAVCGLWPGQQYDATALHDVIRGAKGRVLDYQRVEIVRVEDARAVQGRVVGALVVVLAELLSNATAYSPPNTPVRVHVQLIHDGVAVVIEDAGIGLNHADRLQVRRLLEDESLGLDDLRHPPRFGLAACGAFARQYGFNVVVDDTSAFGGARAVVRIPKTLLTGSAAGAAPVAYRDALTERHDPAEAAVQEQAAVQAERHDHVAAAGGEHAPGPAVPPAPAVPPPPRAPAPSARPTTAHGLPKRSRHAGEPAAEAPPASAAPAPAPAPPDAAPSPGRTPRQAAAPLGAFQRASAERRRKSGGGPADAGQNPGGSE